jgi:hypothetical protein
MIEFQIFNDLQRLVELEARSGEPNAPVRPDRIQAPRVSPVTLIRHQLTSALRWAADVLEPAAPRVKTFPSREGGSC